METAEARNLFISVPLLPLSRAAPPGTQPAVCKFFGMSARACNNFMEITSPAKYSHRVSRASDATRIEKRVAGGKKKLSLPFSLYHGITVGEVFQVSRIERRPRAYPVFISGAGIFFSCPFLPFLSSRSGPAPSLRNATVADSDGNVRLLYR